MELEEPFLSAEIESQFLQMTAQESVEWSKNFLPWVAFTTVALHVVSIAWTEGVGGIASHPDIPRLLAVWCGASFQALAPAVSPAASEPRVCAVHAVH